MNSHAGNYCPGKEAALVINVVSLPYTAYQCGSFTEEEMAGREKFKSTKSLGILYLVQLYC